MYIYFFKFLTLIPIDIMNIQLVLTSLLGIGRRLIDSLQRVPSRYVDTCNIPLDYTNRIRFTRIRDAKGPKRDRTRKVVLFYSTNFFLLLDILTEISSSNFIKLFGM